VEERVRAYLRSVHEFLPYLHASLTAHILKRLCTPLCGRAHASAPTMYDDYDGKEPCLNHAALTLRHRPPTALAPFTVA